MASEQRVGFIDYLESLSTKDDRAALAALRRGLGKPPGTAVEMHRYVVPWLPEGSRPYHEAVYYAVASLYAAHSQPGGVGTLGLALATAARLSGSGSIERRFSGLLNCHEDDLYRHLRQVVSLLRGHSVPVDWHRLFRDVSAWGNPTRFVQRQWARDFWSALPEASKGGQADETGVAHHPELRPVLSQ